MIDLLVNIGKGVKVRPDDIMGICDTTDYQSGFKENPSISSVIMRNGVKFPSTLSQNDLTLEWMNKYTQWNDYFSLKGGKVLNG